MTSYLQKSLRYARRYPLPIWVGLTAIGAVQLRRVLQREQLENQGALASEPKDSIIVSGYKALPLKTLSRCVVISPSYSITCSAIELFFRCWGYVNDLELPVWARTSLLGSYVKIFKCNLDEAMESDVKKYRNLGELFRRRLKPEARPVAGPEVAEMVSACDGQLIHCGQIEADGRLDAIKGVRYSLKDFLGFSPEVREGQRLYQFTIYLAPGDYHGFHAPADWYIRHRSHYDGLLLSVSPAAIRKVPNLFNVNERVVYSGQWQHGFMAMVAVGATNVGSINIPWDHSLQTNPSKRFTSPRVATFDNVLCRRGDYFGEFNLGSTIVVIFEAPATNVSFAVANDSKVKQGQALITAFTQT